MLKTNLNVSPYFDDFDASKGYHQVLFKPRPVQTRELNQLQTILQNQIDRFGKHLFEEGAMVVPGGISVIPQQDNASIVFKLGYSFGDITSRTEQLYIKSNTTGLTAKILKAMDQEDTDPACLFISYENSGDDKQTKLFSNNEDCYIFYKNDVVETPIANVTIQTIGQGTWVKVVEGVYFVRGYFVQTNTQEFVVSKFTTDNTIRVGFSVAESIVDETMDASLYSNAQGEPNYKAPGAARLKIELSLSGKNLTDPVDPNFIEIARLENGVLQNKIDYTTYSILEKTLAQRTYEESGDYTVDAFPIEIKEHLKKNVVDGLYTAGQGGDANKFVVQIKPGIGYVKGYRVQNIGIRNLAVDKAREFDVANNTSASADIGSYIIVNNMHSAPLLDITKRYQLLDSGQNVIGTCAVKGIRKESSTTYRLYIFDQIFTDTLKNLNDVEQISYQDASNLFHADLAYSVLFESSKNSLIFNLPYSSVKSLKINGVSDTSYSVLRSYNVNTDGSGNATISVSGGELFGAVNNFEYVAAYTGSANTGEVIDLSGKIEASGTPVGSVLVVAFGAAHANKTIRFIAPIIKQSPIEKVKSLTSKVQVLSFVDVSKMVLSKSDIFSLTSVISNADGSDLTSTFVFDNGQRDSWYENGSISTSDGRKLNFDVTVTYKYFEHSAGDYFTIDSYGVTREQIPTYTSGSNSFALTDCIDFRPLKDVNGFFTATTVNGEIIKPGDNIRCDMSYYLPRIDVVYVDSNGQFNVQTGISSLNPVEKNIPDNAMKLYVLKLPAYTSNIKNISISSIENRRYTMRDIGKLESRINNLEYYTTLSSLESTVNKTQIVDPVTGNNRYKNGFAVDGFTNFNLADTSDLEWGATLDVENGQLFPWFVKNASDMKLVDGDNYGIRTNTFSLDYTEVVGIEQPNATRTININPYAVFTWSGTVKLTPSSDYWKDTLYLQPIVVNAESNTQVDATSNLTPPLITYSASLHWGDRDRGDFKRRVVSDKTAQYAEWVRSNIERYNAQGAGYNARANEWNVGTRHWAVEATSSVFSSTTSSDALASTEVIPFMRSIDIAFDCQNFRPYTRLYPFFDGVDVSSQVAQTGKTYGEAIVTDSGGRVTGIYKVPNKSDFHFSTGVSLMKFTDSASNDELAASTQGETAFYSGGSLDNIQTTITNTRVTKTTFTISVQKRDPISQTFWMNDDGGAFISKVDVFFSTKAKDIPVTLQLRTVENGMPTGEMMPFGEVVLYPEQVATSDDATASTSFVFDDPIYLEEQKEYAIVLLADTQEYNVYISQLGELLIGEQAALSKQPNLGVFLTSSNGSTWSPNQLQDLKFTVHKCRFNNESSCVINFTNSDPTYVPLAYNAIETTADSNVITVNRMSHGLNVGDSVTLSGAVVGNGFVSSQLNKTHIVTFRTIDRFSLATDGNATATGTIGGSNMTMKANYPFTSLYANVENMILPNTNIKWEYSYRQKGSSSFKDYVEFDVKSDTNVPVEGVIKSEGDLKIRATLTSNKSNLSPIIDTAGLTTSFLGNRINSDVDAPVYVYVTKPIKFDNPSTNARFYISAKLPGSSTMKVYYKAIYISDAELDTAAWVELNPVKPITNDSTSTMEYEYQLGNIGSFTGYVIKVVMLGDDAVQVPILSDFRSIALA